MNKVIKIAITGLALGSFVQSATAAEWVAASQGQSCETACQNEGGSAIHSGKDWGVSP